MAETDIVDADDFSISDGVLSFKFPPRLRDPNIVNGNRYWTLAAKNVYKVVVVASDDATGAALMVPTTTIRMKDYRKVTVTVTDIDEDGSITLSNQQPPDGR